MAEAEEHPIDMNAEIVRLREEIEELRHRAPLRAGTRSGLDLKVPTFSGGLGSSFSVWLKQFLMYCRANLIQEEEQLVLLPALLVDGARDVFESLDEFTQNDFSELVTILKSKLESTELRSLTASEFLNRDQQPHEHINEYALALRRLFYLSYAKDTTDADGLQLRSQILIDRFTKGVKPFISYTMGMQAPAETFDKAVATASRIESNYYASKGYFPSEGGMYANYVTKVKPHKNMAVEELEWLGNPARAFPAELIPPSRPNQGYSNQQNQRMRTPQQWHGQNNNRQQRFSNNNARNWQNSNWNSRQPSQFRPWSSNARSQGYSNVNASRMDYQGNALGMQDQRWGPHNNHALQMPYYSTPSNRMSTTNHGASSSSQQARMNSHNGTSTQQSGAASSAAANAGNTDINRKPNFNFPRNQYPSVNMVQQDRRVTPVSQSTWVTFNKCLDETVQKSDDEF